MAEYGFVYCLRNDAMPGIYKIGFTRGSPHQRAKQLSAPTGVPVDFEVEWYIESDQADLLEKELHELFSTSRLSSYREFFKCCPIDIYTELDRNFLSDWMSPEHLFRIHQKNKILEVVENGQNQNS